jgi:hypothetical protein
LTTTLEGKKAKEQPEPRKEAWQNQEVKAEPDLEQFLAEGGANSMSSVQLVRCEDRFLSSIVGKAHRHAVTGKVVMKDMSRIPDFCIADLWTRGMIGGSTEALTHDPYIFRTVPMPIRTWIYHHMYRVGTILGEKDGGFEEDVMIKSVLKMSCVDAFVSGGKWAPVLLHIPMLFFLSLSCDVACAFVGIFVVLITLTLTFAMNIPYWYRFCRVFSFPLRLTLLIFIVGSMASAEDIGGMQIIGYILGAVTCIVDLLVGDVGFLLSQRLLCTYEVIKTLPNRLFICRRHGAAHSRDIIGKSLPVNEKLTGMGAWQDDFALIADVKGLIMELRPMGLADWKMMADEAAGNENLIHHFVGLDVYSPGAATIDAVNAAIHEAQQMMLMHKQWQLEDA